MERVMSYIKLGEEEGATLLCMAATPGPTRAAASLSSRPVFVDVTNEMRIAQEEIFGPVLVVIPFEDDDDAVRIANESDYGLSGGVSWRFRSRDEGGPPCSHRIDERQQWRHVHCRRHSLRRLQGQWHRS
jgi:acyl-CoA reductase-like NAD-dependent aldehyde dehydrogenase